MSGVLRGYLVLLLLAALVLSPAPQVWTGWGLLAAQALALSVSPRPQAQLGLTLLSVLLVPVALEPVVGPFAAAGSILPVLGLLDRQLHDVAPLQKPPPPAGGTRTTVLLNSVAATMVAAGLLGAGAGSVELSLAAAASLALIVGRVGQILIETRGSPLATTPVSLRVVAGHQRSTRFQLQNRTSYRQRVDLSPEHSWLRLSTHSMAIGPGATDEVEATATPPLAGPVEPAIYATLLDKWGLLWKQTEVRPLRLHVIPRARFAIWMARRYLEQSGLGQHVSTRLARQQRRGVEYARSREYQPGDRAKDIDWRRVAKYRELISKEHQDPQIGAALILVNLVAADAEEADRLAFYLVTSALTAAQEGIPLALATYDDADVILATGLVESREMLKSALRLSGEIRQSKTGEHLLAAPNLPRLRRAVRGLALNGTGDEPGRLADLLEREIESLEDLAQAHPLTIALRRALRAVPPPATVTVVSAWNHDMEALAVTVPRLERRGYRVLDLGVARQA